MRNYFQHFRTLLWATVSTIATAGCAHVGPDANVDAKAPITEYSQCAGLIGTALTDCENRAQSVGIPAGERTKPIPKPEESR
jgi:hypothetical protein